ncbi:glyoxylase I 4 [Nymphaea colorata]|nr:glyoxylase I 4 [Nymphaea colorata]
MASATASYSVVLSLRPPSSPKANLANHCLLLKSSIPSCGSSVVAEWKKKHKVSYICRNSIQGDVLERGSTTKNDSDGVGFLSIHHVGILCENLERSLDFYQNLLGLEINEARPDDKLPYRGAWLWVGSEMIHLMELPNPDPTTGRPEHGGRDRHACLSIRDVSRLKEIFDKAGIPYTLSRSGRPAIFARDPDGNALEFVQAD